MKEKQNELQIVSMEQAIKLKKLGFEWEWHRFWNIIHKQYYDGNYRPYNNIMAPAPTVALALKWLRDVKSISVEILSKGINFDVGVYELSNQSENALYYIPILNSYEESEMCGLDNALSHLLLQANKSENNTSNNMITAKEFWRNKFNEYPQTDSEKLAVAMMTEYARDIVKVISSNT